MSDRTDRRKAEQAHFDAGAGMWFRNSDNQQIVVKCQLYPKIYLWHVVDGEKVAITKAELDSDYHRLRV